MATLEDVLGIYSAQNIIIPILEEHVMNEIMRLDILLSGTTPVVGHTARPKWEMVFTLFGNLLLDQNLMLKTMVPTDF